MLILLAAIVTMLIPRALSEAPAQVKGVWIMPNQFRVGTEDSEKDDTLEKQGKKFLDIYKTLNPALNAKVLSGGDVTRQKVIREIRKQLESFDGKEQPCMFILYYGGHGIRPSTRSRAGSYLALQGAEISSTDPGKMRYDEMIQIDEIFSIVSEFEHVYFQTYIDCCYSANTPGSNLNFSSGFLGNNGFAICSSSSDRQAIATGEKSLTLGLIDVFGSGTFGEIKSPTELFDRIQNSEPAKSLGLCYLPWNTGDSLVQWPLPKLCFLVVDFGQIISRQSVAIKISDSTGNPLFTQVLSNGNQDTLPIFIRSLAVPRSKILMQIRIGSTNTLPPLPEKGYILSLANSGSHHFKIPRPHLPSPQGIDITTAAITTAVESIISQGTEFGMPTEQEQNIVLSALAVGGRVTGGDTAENLPMWASRFNGDHYDNEFLEIVGDFTGSNEIPLNQQGYARLLRLDNSGLTYSAPVAEAYSTHIAANVESQVAMKQGEKPPVVAEWIQTIQLTAGFEEASKATAYSKNPKSLEKLENALEKASNPQTRLFNLRDFNKASKAVGKAKEAVDK